jgi:hypothetical protein
MEIINKEEKENKENKYEGFRVYKIQDNGIPIEIAHGTKEEFLETMDKIDETATWNETYAIRLGKYGLK